MIIREGSALTRGGRRFCASVTRDRRHIGTLEYGRQNVNITRGNRPVIGTSIKTFLSVRGVWRKRRLENMSNMCQFSNVINEQNTGVIM